MSIDPYSLCPGGSGKKIKFCCGDLLDDLNRLDKMVEGEQYAAAIEQIDILLATHAGNESLLALKTRLLRTLGRLEDAAAAAAVFLEAHPDNPVALAESAIVAALAGDGRGGMAKLQRAFAVSTKEFYGRVYEAMGAVAAALLHEGEVCASRSLLQLQIMIAKDDREPLQMLVRINGSPSIPLLFKQDQPWAECPADAAWRPQFDEAMAPVQNGHWAEAAGRLAVLAEEFPDQPALWRNLSTIRDWLADADGCVEALRKLAALDIPQEESVEAEALALLRSEEGFGDEYDVLELDYEIKDADQLAAAFATNDRAQQVPVDYKPVDESDVPPKSLFVLVDRPAPDSAEQLDPDAIPQVIGRAMLFGRQTDCAARLSITGVSSANIDELKAFVSRVGGGQLVDEPKQDTMGQRSATQDLLRRPWYLPRDVTQAQLRDLMQRDTQQALLEQWPQMSLGCLGGKTPAEAAADGALKNRAAALVLVLETTIDASDGDFDFNRLRAKLGLPEAGPINPETAGPAEKGDAASIVATVPLVRLARLEVEKLSDDLLLDGYSRAAAFHVERAIRKFGEAILARPTMKGSDAELDVLSRFCHSERDVDKRFEYVKRGREASKTNGKLCATWDLLELPIRLERGEPQEVGRLVQHLQSKHINEPGVADALLQFMVQIGAINPDGTPTAGMTAAPQEPAAPAAEPEAGKLWTPDGESGGGGDKPALWTPDMG
jgi:hypothetical protein